MKLLKKNVHFLFAGLILIGIISCDKDFNTVGADFVGTDHFNTGLYTSTSTEASNLRLQDVQANNGLSMSLIGRYNDPVYGTTIGEVVNQVSLSQYSPDFGEDPKLYEVVLSMPYFSRVIETDADGASTYELDSIFGTGPMDISFYRTNYFLRDFDPSADFDDPQIYYTDDYSTFEGFKMDLLFSETNFYPSADELVFEEENEDTGEMEVVERLEPRLRIVYDTINHMPQIDYWKNLIFDEAIADKLVSENAFQDYFRGIHIETDNAGHAMMLPLDNATIELKYLYQGIDITDTDGDGDSSELVEQEGSITLTFGQNRVNTFENIFDPAIEGHINANDDDKLYLKGGAGSMAVIDLFGTQDDDGDGVSNELEQLRANNWLINEANLILYVDRATVQGGNTEPERLYLYDLDGRGPLIDFFAQSAGATAEVAANHLGVLERDEFDKGISYKMKITEHVKNVINNDSTNVPLGLVVSGKVDDFNLSRLKDAVDPDPVIEFPTSSVYSPKGTVIFNHNSSDPVRRLKLQIYYTEQDN